MINALVVDDEKEIREIVKSYLEEEGSCFVDVSPNAEWGIHSLKNKDYDIIFLDYKLQGDLDGFDLLSKIKERGIKVVTVMISGHLEDLHQVKEKANEALPNEFLPKPFDAQSVKRIMEKYFPQEKEL